MLMSPGYLMSGMLPYEHRRQRTGLRFMGPFEASDGWVFIHTSPRMMDRLLKGTGVDKLESREDLENWAAERKVNDVVDALVTVGVPAAPINTLKEVVEDPHVDHRGMIVSVDHPDAGTVRFPNHPIKYSGVKPEMRMAAPLLGQHNEEVLTDLGYSENEIEELRMTKVIT